jgi:hypothetical protein
LPGTLDNIPEWWTRSRNDFRSILKMTPATAGIVTFSKKEKVNASKEVVSA